MGQFKTIEEILSSDFSFVSEGYAPIPKSDRVLKSTKIEQAIFKDLYEDADELSELEEQGKQKLNTFDSLINDVFQSVYSLKPRQMPDEDISNISKRFNKFIIENLMKDDNYTAVKSVCEGKELSAIAATSEFTSELLSNLDSLMERATGGKGKLAALDKMEQDKQNLISELSELLKGLETVPETQKEAAHKKILNKANRILSKQEQQEMYSNVISNNMSQSSPYVRHTVSQATTKALERAEETECAIMAWGDGDAEMKKNPINTEILKRTASSHKLRYIARFLGRYKEMLNSKRLSGYSYGMGEKYDIEYGNSISRLLTSELSMLASRDMIPLFMKKYQNKNLKQYRKREPLYKGKGDIIVCLDESSSTFGENNAYGMAIAMVFYEICKINKSNFALVHFSADTKVDYFPKNVQATSKQVMNCAETFLGGGTNFERPLKEVFALTSKDMLEKPDIVFITDGICDVSDEFSELFNEFKVDTGAKLTGILLDKGENFKFTLQKFADCIYRTSELLEEKIVENLIDERI